MTPSEKARVKEYVQELSEILYRNTSSEKCQTLEDIEKTVREHLLGEQVTLVRTKELTLKLGVIIKTNK